MKALLKLPPLQQRVITASVLIPVVLLGIFLLPEKYFMGISGLIFIFAGWEWSALCGIKKMVWRILYTGLISIFIYLSYWMPVKTMLILGVLIWALAFLNFFQYAVFFTQLAGVVMLPVCWRGLNYLCFAGHRPWKLMELFLIVWLADTAAYFIGRRFGKHKLAPDISPHKSIEGALGAVVVVGIVMGIIYQSVNGVIFSVIVVIASIIGDLFESSMKRKQQLKDSGKILPGHGGILDRIDSLIAAVPVFALGVLLLRF